MPVRTFGDGGLRVGFPSTVKVHDATRPATNSVQSLLQDDGAELIRHFTLRITHCGGATVDIDITLRGDEVATVRVHPATGSPTTLQPAGRSSSMPAPTPNSFGCNNTSIKGDFHDGEGTVCRDQQVRQPAAVKLVERMRERC
jgi:hypothetical protein